MGGGGEAVFRCFYFFFVCEHEGLNVYCNDVTSPDNDLTAALTGHVAHVIYPLHLSKLLPI